MSDQLGVKRVLLVDDVDIDIRKYQRGIRQVGTYTVDTASTVAEALNLAASAKFDVAVLDLKMPPGPLGDVDTDYGEETGYALAGRLIAMNPEIRIIVLSHESAGDVLEPAFRQRLNIADMLVKGETSPLNLIHSIDHIFGARSLTPSIFIVHGHDRSMVDLVQNVVANDLGWSRPVVLDQQPGAGLTIIEKFEKFASHAEAVIVLMTPDDVGSSSRDMDQQQFRARQNVLFELGYFYGKFPRRSGRVFVLKSGDLEMPSDLAGIIYLDISGDVDAAKATLARELRHAFAPVGDGGRTS